MSVVTRVRKLTTAAIGIALILTGIAGLLLPFLPGWLLILSGLAVLSTEYVWARRLTDGARRHATSMTRRRNRDTDLAA